jgi:hypothetical protein
MLVLEIGLEVEQDNWLAAILHIFDAVYPCVSGDIAKYFQTGSLGSQVLPSPWMLL